MRPTLNTTRVAWRLARSYWTSEERWSGWGLLVAVVALNLGNVYISVQINEWNKSFYNALQAFNREEMLRQLGYLLHFSRFCDFDVCLCSLL